MIRKHDVDIARAAGKERGLAGGDMGENPHNMAQGSETRILGFAWNKGFREGAAIRAYDDEKQMRLFR